MKSTGIVEGWKDGKGEKGGDQRERWKNGKGEPFGPERLDLSSSTGLTAEGLMSCRFRKEGGMRKAGEAAAAICSTCLHPQAFFELYAHNY